MTTSVANGLRPSLKIRAFLFVVVTIYAGLFLVWWSGIGAIHAAVRVDGSSTELEPGRRTARLTLTNDAPTAFTVRRVEIIDGRFTGITTTQPTVEGRQRATVSISYALDCGASRPFPNAPIVEVYVETLAGLERHTFQESAVQLEC